MYSESKEVKEAIANISSVSEALEKYCKDPKNYNSCGAQLLEQTSYELYKIANELKEFEYNYGFWS